MSARGDERGVAMPSPVAAVSLLAVLGAGVAFAVTSDEADTTPTAGTATAKVPEQPAPPPTAASPTTQPTKEAEPKRKKQKPAVRRAEVYVEVYNNSGIAGLAGSTAGRIGAAGWQVVGSDNWYGTVPASTVYYPERLQPAARMLARDLGIQRTKPAIAPMRFDRLTVILTSDYT